MPASATSPQLAFAHPYRPHNDHRHHDIHPSSSSAASSSNIYLPWQHHHLHNPPHNPYPQPPPPIPHTVWILDCKSCATFLTNRGMKAVLLLRPNVSLYSSDALPVNCSAYTTNPDVLRPRPACNPPPSHIPPRTCECLTQTLCCHGCGSTVGYMIVIPCVRCTSSITATNRATNGHRFVFHASEVLGTERRYILDEPGVIPFEPPAVVMSSHFGPSQASHHPYPHSTHREQQPSLSTSTTNPNPTPPSPHSDYLPTPPLEFADLSIAPTLHPPDLPAFLSENISGFSRSHIYPHVLHSHSRSSSPLIHPAYMALRPPSADPSSSPSLPPFVSPAEKEQPVPRKLKSGDTLFWHHLARTGEIPGVADNIRARGRPSSPVDEKLAGKVVFNR